MTKTKKTAYAVDHYFNLHKKLLESLGEDLVVSISLDSGMHIVSVSTHKSKTQKFNHDKLIQSAVLSPVDLLDNSNAVVETLIKMFKEILVEKTEEDAIENKNYAIDIEFHDKDGNKLQ